MMDEETKYGELTREHLKLLKLLDRILLPGSPYRGMVDSELMPLGLRGSIRHFAEEHDKKKIST